MVWLQDQRILRRKTSIIPFYYFPKPLKYTELINVEAFNRNKTAKKFTVIVTAKSLKVFNNASIILD